MLHAVIEARPQERIKEPGEVLRIPPPVHVRFTETEGTLCQDAVVEPLIVQLHVSRLLSVDDNAARVEYLLDLLLGSHGATIALTYFRHLTRVVEEGMGFQGER